MIVLFLRASINNVNNIEPENISLTSLNLNTFAPVEDLQDDPLRHIDSDISFYNNV